MIDANQMLMLFPAIGQREEVQEVLRLPRRGAVGQLRPAATARKTTCHWIPTKSINKIRRVATKDPSWRDVGTVPGFHSSCLTREKLGAAGSPVVAITQRRVVPAVCRASRLADELWLQIGRHMEQTPLSRDERSVRGFCAPGSGASARFMRSSTTTPIVRQAVQTKDPTH
jgi:hypothetical protein